MLPLRSFFVSINQVRTSSSGMLPSHSVDFSTTLWKKFFFVWELQLSGFLSSGALFICTGRGMSFCIFNFFIFLLFVYQWTGVKNAAIVREIFWRALSRRLLQSTECICFFNLLDRRWSPECLCEHEISTFAATVLDCLACRVDTSRALLKPICIVNR